MVQSSEGASVPEDGFIALVLETSITGGGMPDVISSSLTQSFGAGMVRRTNLKLRWEMHFTQVYSYGYHVRLAPSNSLHIYNVFLHSGESCCL